MTTTQLKNKIEWYNPLARIRRKRMRERLKNKDITLLTPNCLGGLLFHDLGLKFMSPTINLMMTQGDFIKFVLNLESYLKEPLRFFKHMEHNCPCAKLKDIEICFTHYTSEKEAAEKWEKRAKRINKNNLFIFCEERDGITKDEIKSLSTVNAKGIVVFTAHQYDDIPYALFVPKYHNDGMIGNILSRNILDDSREYEKYFDFVKWFNNADGKNYDISEYKQI